MAKKAKKEETLTTSIHARLSWVFLTSRFAAIHKIDTMLAKACGQDYDNREIVQQSRDAEVESLIRDISLTTGQVLNEHQLRAFRSAELSLAASEEMSRVAFELENGQSKYSIETTLDRQTLNFVDQLLLARAAHPYGKLNYTPTHFLSGVWSKEYGNQTISMLLDTIYAHIIKRLTPMIETPEELAACIAAGKYLPILFTNEVSDYDLEGAAEALDESILEKEVWNEEDWSAFLQISKLTLVTLVETLRREQQLTVDEELLKDFDTGLELVFLCTLGSMRDDTNLDKLTEASKETGHAVQVAEAVEEAKEATLQ